MAEIALWSLSESNTREFARNLEESLVDLYKLLIMLTLWRAKRHSNLRYPFRSSNSENCDCVSVARPISDGQSDLGGRFGNLASLLSATVDIGVHGTDLAQIAPLKPNDRSEPTATVEIQFPFWLHSRSFEK